MEQVQHLHEYLLRQRAQVRNHRQTINAMKTCWKLVPRANPKVMSREEYENLYSTLLYEMTICWDEETNDVALAKMWHRDASAFPNLDFNRFCCSIFYFAEMWVQEITQDAYDRIFGVIHTILAGQEFSSMQPSTDSSGTTMKLTLESFDDAINREKEMESMNLNISKSISFDAKKYFEHFGSPTAVIQDSQVHERNTRTSSLRSDFGEAYCRRYCHYEDAVKTARSVPPHRPQQPRELCNLSTQFTSTDSKHAFTSWYHRSQAVNRVVTSVVRVYGYGQNRCTRVSIFVCAIGGSVLLPKQNLLVVRRLRKHPSRHFNWTNASFRKAPPIPSSLHYAIVQFASSYAFGPLALSMMMQHPYVAGPPTPKAQVIQNGPFREQEHPIRRASLLSMLSMSWLQPLISLGAKRALEREDVWAMCPEDTCEVLRIKFEEELRAVNNAVNAPPMGIPRVAVALVKTFYRPIALVFACDLLFIAGSALMSLLVESILDYLNDRGNIFGIRNGYVLVVMLSFVAFVAMMSFNFAWFISSRVGVNMRSLLLDAVYRKSLRLSSESRQKYSSGEIMTLVSVDIDRVFNGMMNGPWVLLAPVGFAVTIVLIGVLFDPIAALAGLVLLIVVLATSFNLAKRIGRARRELLPVTEERLRVTSEALQGIRVTKFYAWNESIAKRVERIRREEVRRYRRFHFLQILNSALLFLTPTILAGVTVGVYVVYRGTFSVVQAFTLIAAINVSRQGVNAFPLGIADLSQSAVACHRIDSFLDSKELETSTFSNVDVDCTSKSDVGADTLVKGSIFVENAQFCWPSSTASASEDRKDDFACDATAVKTLGLEGINFQVDAGSLVMIVGTVGSGKSSLLQALLGEMQMTAGRAEIHGEISYVSQEAWIRNATLRDNIVFESEFDGERYEKVLSASQLTLDLTALPSGDRTEIGERGINLSGGQKARVSVARALYRSSSDILILDDPLSAVDPHVAHAIFDHCILGLAKHKTRVLVVNSHYDLLSYADKVVVMQNGRIAGEGSYESVVSRFPELLAHKSREPVEIASVDENTPRPEGKEQLYQTEKVTSEDEDVHSKDQLMEKEDRVKGRVTSYIYKTYLDETGFSAFVVVLIVTTGYSVSQGLLVLVNWWQAYWADNIPQQDGDSSYSVTWFGLWYFGFIAFGAVATVCRSVTVMLLLLRSSKNLHDELFRRVLAAPVNTYFDVTPVGRILNRFSNDLDQMDSLLPQQWQNFVQNVSLSVGGFIVCALASYWIGLSYIPVVVALIVTGVYFKKTSREVKRLEGISRSPVYNLLGETLNGVQTIRAFKMQETFEGLNASAVDENASFYFIYWAAGRWLAVRLDTLSVVVIFVVSLYLVATKGQLGTLLSGISLVYALMLTSMVQSSVRDVDRTDNAMTSVERILHFREIPQEQDAPDTRAIDSSKWPLQGAITFDNLQLKYRPELPLVLRGVNMNISGSEKIGICGRTGAGKSSLMIALFRICEFDGAIRIDGIDIRQVKLDDLRRSLATIPQDPVLFSGPLRDNLDPFGEYSDAEIWAVLRQVHLADTVTSWGAGLHFVLSEKGDNLSVGQRQLLCIGRALLKNSKIVVLDEATANVDTATDNLIQETIRDTFQDQTVLIIAHRINTIMHCNKIAVMEAGRVAEFGSPPELLCRSNSLFAALAKRSGHRVQAE